MSAFSASSHIASCSLLINTPIIGVLYSAYGHPFAVHLSNKIITTITLKQQ
jgi:hypothetical protein